MKVTVFQSTKTTGKHPYSPTGDLKFIFESYNVSNISEVFFELTSNFMLNIPLIKGTKIPYFRRKEALDGFFVKKLDWVTVDIDKIKKMSDREICVNWFREQKYECILAESRNPLNIKGIMKVDNLTPREAKQSLREIQKHIPGEVDLTVTHYASYQAPIRKAEILYQGEGKPLQKTDDIIMDALPITVTVPDNIRDICRNKFIEKGFVFHEGNVCSHYSEKKSPKGFTWSDINPFKMMHWNPDRVVDVWAEVIKTKEYRDYNKEKAKQSIIDIIPNTTESKLNKRFLDRETETVQDFLNNYKILKIQSPMGTAKSTVIDEVITQSTQRELRVLLITNRITLADDIAKKYNNIKHYLDTEVDENGPYNIGDNLVCQVNSLWKYSLKYFDVVIIDEVTSLMFQMLSLTQHSKNVVTKLFATRQKKIVLADAFLFDDIVEQFGKPEDTISINNSYRDKVDLIIYSQLDKLVHVMIKEAKQGYITVSAGSTKLLKTLEMIFENAGISYFTISAETTKREKELVYKELQKINPKWRVIMYSPTITVGISILADSDHHFHIDRGNSMDVISSIQMIKRNRSAKNIHMFLQEIQKYETIEIDRIENRLLDFAQEDDQGDSLGISEVGHKFAKVHKIYNTLENRHKISFLSLLKTQFEVTGNITQCKEKVKPFMVKLGKIVKRMEVEHNLNLFEEYKLMTAEEISEVEYSIFNKTKDQEMLTWYDTLTNDETLNLSKEHMEMLIKEEIKITGIIDCYKLCLLSPEVIDHSNGYSYNLKKKTALQNKGIDILLYGYKKEQNRHVYRLNPVLQMLCKFHHK